MSVLPRTFYDRPTVVVARDLLGRVLVRMLDGERLAGRIVETEAYIGPEDLACHARAGRTARTNVLFGPPGHAYIYFTYGMHWMLNTVTENEGHGSGVLLRALEPLEGVERIAANRQAARGPMPPRAWTSGPARLTQALQIDGSLKGTDLTGDVLFIEPGEPVPDENVQTGPRVGITYTPEPWRSQPWRFWLKDSPFVSNSR